MRVFRSLATLALCVLGWLILTIPAWTEEVTSLGPQRVVVIDVSALQPGTHFYALTLGEDGSITFAPITVIVVPIPPSPGPIPPTPIPPTPVPPTPDKISSVIIVEESADRTVQMGELLASPKLQDWKAEHEVGWHVLDKDMTDEDGRSPKQFDGYFRLSQDRSLPVLILDNDSDDDNGVLYVGDLPETVDELLKLLNGDG